MVGSHTGIIDAHWSSVQKQAKNIAEADISFILFHSSIFWMKPPDPNYKHAIAFGMKQLASVMLRDTYRLTDM